MSEVDWDRSLGSLARDLGDQVLDAAKTQAGEAWDELEDMNKEQLATLARLQGKLLLREMAGEDVSGLQAHLESQIADLVFTNKAAGLRAVQGFFVYVAKLGGELIGGAASRFLGGLV